MSDLVMAAAASVGVMLMSFWLVMLISWMSEKFSKNIMPLWLQVILTIVIWIGSCAGGLYLRLKTVRKADETAAAGFVSEEYVTVHKTDYGWFFDGWGTGSAAVFYGERGVQEEAYAPLLKATARQGLDCFLYKMPYSIPDFQYDAYADIIERHSGYSWFMMCHGNGNEAASKYFAEHKEDFAGMITLGTYPLTELDESQLWISIIPENDRLMDHDAYLQTVRNNKAFIRENTIRGGGSSGFAACGLLNGDTQAAITPALQQVLSAQVIRQTMIGQ